MNHRTSIIGAAILALAAAAAGAAPSVSGQGSSGMALGAFLGQPTGVTFRLGLDSSSSIEAKAAWSLVGSTANETRFTFQANWLLEFPGVLGIEGLDFPLYTGAGAQVDLGAGATSIGFRIPAGVVYRFPSAPIELCLEIGVGMQVFPATTFLGSGGLGVRYRF